MALQRIARRVAQSSDGHIAEGESRKDRRVLPVLAAHQRLKHLVAPEWVAAADEGVQHDELSADVEEVEQLDDDVERRHVPADAFAEAKALNAARDPIHDAFGDSCRDVLDDLIALRVRLRETARTRRPVDDDGVVDAYKWE